MGPKTIVVLVIILIKAPIIPHAAPNPEPALPDAQTTAPATIKALLIRKGFWANYTIIVTRKPQNNVGKDHC